MTNDPDMTHVTDKVVSYCPTHQHTAFVCLKCQTAATTHESAPSSDLATIKELQALRAENERLTAEIHQFVAYLNFHQDKMALILNPAGVIQALERILNGGAS